MHFPLAPRTDLAATSLRKAGVLVLAALLAACAWRPDSPAKRLATLPAVEAPPSGVPPVAAITARWFGVSTLLFSDGQSSILIDGFFSRPGRNKVLFEKLEPDEKRITAAFESGNIGKVGAVLLAHSHYDHAMDSHVVAAKAGALLVASESGLRIARAAKARNRLCAVKDGDRIDTGKFQVEVFATPHSPTLLSGTIGSSFRLPARSFEYKLGDNYSFLIRHPLAHILVVPSANSATGMLRGASADVVFLGIGGLGKRHDDDIGNYWKEAVEKPQAKLVIPVHWDDFTQPFAEPLRPLPFLFDDVGHTVSMLEKLARPQHGRVQIRLMPLVKPVALPSVARAENDAAPAVCAHL